jgi:hypothetical protein
MEAGELYKAKEVLDVVLPAGDEAAEVVHPGKEPLHFPPPTITAKLSSILCLAAALPVGRDQLPARTSSTSWHSAGEALCTETARGRLLLAAIATIFVPLPRRVEPTARPPFWRSRRSHRRTPRPSSTARAYAGVAPVAAAPPPASRFAPTAGIGDGRFGTTGIAPAVHATARRCLGPTTPQATRRVCRATDDPVHPTAAAVAAPVPPTFIVRRSLPSVPASAHSEISRASPECHLHSLPPFMRLALECQLRRELPGRSTQDAASRVSTALHSDRS